VASVVQTANHNLYLSDVEALQNACIEMTRYKGYMIRRGIDLELAEQNGVEPVNDEGARRKR
jgi:hypothetical protein